MRLGLLFAFTAIKFSVVVYAEGDDCHDCFEWLVFGYGLVWCIVNTRMKFCVRTL